MVSPKRVFLPLIIGVLVLDVVALFGGPWLLGRSQCSLTESLNFAWPRSTPRYFASQISLQKTEDGLDLWKTPHGPIWSVHGDQALPLLLSEQFRDIYEPNRHEVRPGDIVLDCGANIGIFTRTALARGAGLVVAIEPAPLTLRALRRNFEAEIRAGRVLVYPKGAWDHDAEMELSLDDISAAKSSLVIAPSAGNRKVRVPLTTIDEIVAELKLPRVDFIKMDIEGAEKPALSGAKNTIRRFRPRMSISTEHLADDFTAIPALVNSIEPSYRHRGCDCIRDGTRVKALVLAFDPIRTS